MLWRLQDDEALELAQELGAELLLARVVGSLELRHERLGGVVGILAAELLEVEALELRGRLQHRRAQRADVLLLGLQRGVDVALHLRVDVLGDHVLDVLADVVAEQDVAALGVHHLALLAHDVVVVQELLADAEVTVLDALLGALDGAGDHARFDGLTVV
ncbi:MAG: hypothetical protein P8Y02_04050, partial [Deinococcales bacterium]